MVRKNPCVICPALDRVARSTRGTALNDYLNNPRLMALSAVSLPAYVQNAWIGYKNTMRLHMNDERERRLRRLMEETGENTKSGAIDTAMKHYLADKRNKEKAISGLSDADIEALSTPQLPLSREVEHTVGQDE